jgi:hypothetical protein
MDHTAGELAAIVVGSGIGGLAAVKPERAREAA